jgi:hypothetical protein
MRPGLAVLDERHRSAGHAVVLRDGVMEAWVSSDRDHLPRLELVSAMAPLVVRLLQMARPAAVARFVVAIVVDAIDRLVRRRLTHIGEERREALGARPALTNPDAARAVVALIVSGRPATGMHRLPNAIGAGSVAPSAGAVLDDMLAQAAAIVAAARTQIRAAHLAFYATIAAAKPSAVRTAAAFTNTQDRPGATAVPGQIDNGRGEHDDGYSA